MYKKLLKNCSAASLGLILSKISGLAKIAIVAALFGAGEEMDAWLVAFTVPSMAGFVLGEAVYVATVRLASRHLVQGSRDEAKAVCADGWREISALLNLVTTAVTLLTLLYVLFAPKLLKILAPGFDPERLDLASSLTILLSPAIVVISVQGGLHAILHVHGSFFMPSLRRLFTNIFTIFISLWLYHNYGVAACALGMVAGEFISCGLAVWAVTAVGARYTLSARLHWLPLRNSLATAVPAMLCVGALQVTSITDRAFASILPPGSIAALGYAMLLLMSAITFLRTIVDAGFPSLTALANKADADADADTAELRAGIMACFKTILFAGVPSTLALLLGRSLLIRLMLQRGKFDEAAAGAASIALLYYSLAMMPLLLRHFFTRLAQSLGKPMLPLPGAVAAAVSSVLLNLLLVPLMGHAGIALSLAGSTALHTVLLFVQLQRSAAVMPCIAMRRCSLQFAGAGIISLAAYAITGGLSGSSIAASGAAIAGYAAGLKLTGIVSSRHILRLNILRLRRLSAAS